MSEVTMYEVQQGDCVSSISEKAGLLWQTLWNHPDNTKLRELRKDPNVLMPGDMLAVPRIRLKEVLKPTGARHKFVRKGNQAKVKLRFLNEGEPRASVKYVFEVVNGGTHEGVTDAEGYLTVPIPPNATSGKLILKDDTGASEEYTIQLGHLDPIEEIVGVQKRLRNLGFECQATGELDDVTKAALASFRNIHKLPQSDEIDEELRAKLRTAHGS